MRQTQLLLHPTQRLVGLLVNRVHSHPCHFRLEDVHVSQVLLIVVLGAWAQQWIQKVGN